MEHREVVAGDRRLADEDAGRTLVESTLVDPRARKRRCVLGIACRFLANLRQIPASER